MWVLEFCKDYVKRSKDYHKRWQREWVAVHDNLDTYVVTLNEGVHPLQVKFGFVRGEGKGCVAIDESGHGKLKATRLFIYPEVETHVIHVITIGDKSSQQGRDIQFCHRFIEERTRVTGQVDESDQDGTRPGPGDSE